MARPIEYRPTPLQTDTAADALNDLLEALHQGGVLRLATNLVQQSGEVAEVALNQLGLESSQRLINNLLVIMGFLAKTEPEALEKLLNGLSQGVNEAQREHKTPGAFGLMRELNDPEVRRGLSALLTVLGSLGQALREPKKE